MASLQLRVKILVCLFLLLMTIGTILYAFRRFSTSPSPPQPFNAFDGIQIVLVTMWMGSGILALLGAIKRKKYHLIPLGFVLSSTLILNLLFCFYLLNEIRDVSGSPLLNGDYWKAILGFGIIFSSSGLAIYLVLSIYLLYGQLVKNTKQDKDEEKQQAKERNKNSEKQFKKIENKKYLKRKDGTTHLRYQNVWS